MRFARLRKTNLETAVEFLPRPRQRSFPLDHWLRLTSAKMVPFITGPDTKSLIISLKPAVDRQIVRQSRD